MTGINFLMRGGWSAGVGISDLRRVVDYWQNHYDWRAVEDRINRLPNYKIEIQGQPIHFLHLKGDGLKPPVLLLHGWPVPFLSLNSFWDLLRRMGTR